MSLTPAQYAAKARVEAAGGIFLAPSEYKRVKYKKSALKVNPQQVASYSIRKSMKETMNNLSPDAEQLVDQSLNPEDVNDIERWPNTYGLSSVYKCKTVFSAKFAEDGRSCVSVSPTIKDSIFTTWGDESTITLDGYGSTGSGAPYSFQQVVLDELNITTHWGAPILGNNGQAILPFPFAPLSRLLYPVMFGMSPGSAATTEVVLYMALPNAIANQARGIVYLYDSGFNSLGFVQQDVQQLSNPDIMGMRLSLGSNADVNNLQSIAYISINLRGRALPYRGPVYIWFNNESDGNGTSSLVMPNHAQHVGIYDIKDADSIRESASQAFVLSQSLLLTAEMADINNGGMLAIARVPGNNPIGMDGIGNASSIVNNNWYEWLSSMPNNNYDGPVKDGGYGFYLPEDETGFFYRPIDNFFSTNLPYLAAEFTVSPDLVDAATVRIKIATIVQFTTTSSIYDQRPSCHIPDIEIVHHVLSLVPACYSNDGHREALKQHLRKVGGRVKSILKNPKTYLTAAEILAKLIL